MFNLRTVRTSVLLGCLAASWARGDVIGFATRSVEPYFSELYRVNLNTGSAARIGWVPGAGGGNLAYDVDSCRVLTYSYDSIWWGLTAIDPSNGAWTFIENSRGPEAEGAGLERDGAGNVWLVDAYFRYLHVWTPDTWFQWIGPLDREVEGLAWAAGTLYGLGDNPHVLVTIDTATGATTPVGSEFPFDYDAGGLAFDENGTLWGIADNGLIFTIDSGSGSVSVVAATLPGLHGLAIPEPGTGLVALLALGAIGTTSRVAARST